ncbi:MAG TPA: TRAP transporter substrate-binding protein DctP [Propionibacterium sp.]|nr:TRAP transporter substrate-binding protein DctP [Propionibacterium sp.]
MIRNRTRILSAAVGAALVPLLAACGSGTPSASSPDSKELTVATHAARNSRGEAVTDWYFKEVEARTGGTLTFKVTAPDSLCPPPEIGECTRDGRADVGVSVSEYAPQLFPTATVVGIPFVSQDSAALMSAFYEVNTTHTGAKAVWEKNGLHLVGHWSPGRMNIGTKTPLTSPGDLNNQRIRTAGAYLERALDTQGASNVSVTASETYEAVERGLADGTGFALDGALDFKLTELLPYWTDVNTGHYSTFGLWLNKDVYDGLTDAQKKAIDDVAAELNGGKGIEAIQAKAAEQCTSLVGNDDISKISKWDDSVTKPWRDAVGSSLVDRWVQDAEAAGLSDARGYYEAYVAAMEANVDTAVTDPIDTCYEQFEGRS